MLAQKPYIVWSLGPKALIYEALDPWGNSGLRFRDLGCIGLIGFRIQGLGFGFRDFGFRLKGFGRVGVGLGTSDAGSTLRCRET